MIKRIFLAAAVVFSAQAQAGPIESALTACQHAAEGRETDLSGYCIGVMHGTDLMWSMNGRKPLCKHANQSDDFRAVATQLQQMELAQAVLTEPAPAGKVSEAEAQKRFLARSEAMRELPGAPLNHISQAIAFAYVKALSCSQ